MGVSIRELARRFEKALEEKLKPTGYDSDGTVTRIEDGKIWVHIPGGVPETPVDITMAAEVGDAVKVRLSGGKAWLTGNKSEPPTGDKIAKEAQHLAMSSNKRVAKIEAEIANGDIGGGTVIWTTTADPVLPDYTFTITDLQGEGTPKVDDIIFAGAYRYVIRSVGSTTLLAGDRESIRGADGATITGVTEMYALSATTTAPADEDFSPNVQTPTEQLPYLWNMEIISYSTGTSTPQAKHILLTYTAGVEGRGISAVTEYYCRSTSLTAPADADFGTSVPTLTETYKYLWNYELITYTDETRPTTTDKRIIGVYGNRGYGITQLTTHMRSQPLATIMSWVGLVNDTWSGVTSYGGQIGDTVLIACQVTDHDNIVGYMRCVVKGYNSGTQVLTTDNLDFMMGEQGERGPQGPQGPTGPQGPPGKTRVTLQNGDDLNNCITKDYVYVTSSTAVCNSLLNTPYGFPAGELELEVLWLGSDNYIVQKLTCKDGATRKVYLRTYSSGVFGAWTEEGVPYGLCNTTAGTAAKVASISCYDRDSNPYVAIKFTYENTAASPTLNINNIGAAQIMTNGTNSAYWAAGATVNFYWDGTYYQVASSPVYASEVTVGDPNGDNVHIGNGAVQLRRNGKVRTQLIDDGLEVLASDETTRKALFGETAQIGERSDTTICAEFTDNDDDGDIGMWFAQGSHGQIGGITSSQRPSDTVVDTLYFLAGDKNGNTGQVTVGADRAMLSLRHRRGIIETRSGYMGIRKGDDDDSYGYTDITSDNLNINKAGDLKAGKSISAPSMIGQIVMFAGASAKVPTGWKICDGSALSRTTYSGLYNVIGTTWGSGNGSTTFNIPDLRGRAPVGAGQGTGLTDRTLGDTVGAETVKLTAAQSGLPAHTHTLAGKVAYTTDGFAGDQYDSLTGTGEKAVRTETASDGVRNMSATGAVSGGASAASSAHNNMQPSAVVNYIIFTGVMS